MNQDYRLQESEYERVKRALASAARCKDGFSVVEEDLIDNNCQSPARCSIYHVENSSVVLRNNGITLPKVNLVGEDNRKAKSRIEEIAGVKLK